MFQVFPLGPFLVWTRLVFLLIGIWLSGEFFFRLAQSGNLSLQHFRDHALRYIAAFLFFGRISAVLVQYRIYFKDPLQIFVLWDGGFTFLGGALGIGLVLAWATSSHRATFLQWLDVLLPAACFGMAWSWIGRFFSGYAFGKPTDVFWGVTYDAIQVRYSVPIHPVQLYYALFFFCLTFLLLIVRKYAKRAGTETLVGIFFAAIGTFILEYFRGDFYLPVYATQADFLVLLALFISLGVFAVVELKLPRRSIFFIESILLAIVGGYLLIRSRIDSGTYELRFSQFLSILALLATVVYVTVHRRRYPHL